MAKLQTNDVTTSSIKVETRLHDGTTNFNAFKLQRDVVATKNMCNDDDKAVALITSLRGVVGNRPNNVGSKTWIVEPYKECTKDNIIIGKAIVPPVNNLIPVWVSNPTSATTKVCEGDIIAQCQTAEYMINHQAEVPKTCAKISQEAEILVKRWTSKLDEQRKKYPKKFLLENLSIFDAVTNSAYPVPGEKFILDIDASAEGLGSVLSQQIAKPIYPPDENVNAILTAIEKEERPTCEEIARESPITKAYWDQWQSRIVEDGCLWRIWHN
uniref:Reverse transcriptase/retrotransposon-derived protein RNase H-like domain-containing protein n=1 Tax=Glossina austeni TaxID=7395 RepID=A0A1A9VFK1_GLOAU